MKAKTVRIGSIDYDLQLLDQVNDYVNNEKLDGQISFARSEIQVLSKLSKRRIFQTLLHECLHGLLETASVEVAKEELLVSALAPVLASFLRDNWRLLQRMGDLK